MNVHDIPIIDLDNISEEATMANLNDAARRFGTFYITCREVRDALELSLDAFDATKRFFRENQTEKLKCKPYRDGLLQGYMTSNRFAFDPKRKATNDVRQFFIVPPAHPRPEGTEVRRRCFRHLPRTRPQEYTLFTAPRIFPNAEFQSTTTAFQAACLNLHSRVLDALARCLGVQPAAMHDLCSQQTCFLAVR